MKEPPRGGNRPHHASFRTAAFLPLLGRAEISQLISYFCGPLAILYTLSLHDALPISELLGLADARAAAVVERAAPVVGRLLARAHRTSLAMGAGTAALGAALFVASSPGAGRAAAFWHPLRAIVDAGAPLRLAVDRLTVRRGDSVTVTLQAPAATRAILWTRGPGEPWR